jgi:hypothetical protein
MHVTSFNFRNLVLYAYATPQIRRLNAGFSLQRLVLNPVHLHVRFTVDEVAMGQVFSEFLRFSPANHHSATAQYTSPPSESAIALIRQHIFGLQLGSFISDLALGCLQSNKFHINNNGTH